MDQRTRKLIIMHPWDDIDRLNVLRREGGWDARIENNIDA